MLFARIVVYHTYPNIGSEQFPIGFTNASVVSTAFFRDLG
jgi:hypothetical protein